MRMLTGCGPLPTLPMGATLSPDTPMGPFECGIPTLVLLLAILWRVTLYPCGPLPTLPMGATSSLDPLTGPSEFGMPTLVLRTPIISKDMMIRCGQLLSPPRHRTLCPDPMTVPVEIGMLMSRPWPESLSTTSLPQCSPMLTLLPIGSKSFLGLLPAIPLYWMHSHIYLSNHVIQSPIWMVGSETRRVAYYTGYPKIVV